MKSLPIVLETNALDFVLVGPVDYRNNGVLVKSQHTTIETIFIASMVYSNNDYDSYIKISNEGVLNKFSNKKFKYILSNQINFDIHNPDYMSIPEPRDFNLLLIWQSSRIVRHSDDFEFYDLVTNHFNKNITDIYSNIYKIFEKSSSITNYQEIVRWSLAPIISPIDSRMKRL